MTLSAVSGKLVSVNYSTADGSAAAGADYVSASGTLSIPAGATSAAINVQVVGDTTNEPDETFAVNLSAPLNATLAASQGVGTIVNDDTPRVQMGAGALTVAEGGAAEIVVTRTGDTSGEAFVSYATADVTANSRQDYTAAFGRLRFAPGEVSKTLRVIVSDDRFDDDAETFTFTVSDPAGAELGSQVSTTVTITDNDAADGPSPVSASAFDGAFFVRQHYADFLNREPDAPGLAFWTDQTTNCGNADLLVCRINVSAAFFLSTEFQETGYLVYKTYGAAFGTRRVGSAVPVTLQEFLPDTQAIGRGVIVNEGDWKALLEANKVAYFNSFVQRAPFLAAYPQSMTAAQFVDALNVNAGNVLTQAERDQLVSDLASGAKTRAQVLRAVAENDAFTQREKDRAFVLTEYFGYLRRNPFDAPEPTLDFAGFNFWLGKLEEHGGNYITAEMVKAFITSGEYQQRFGQ